MKEACYSRWLTRWIQIFQRIWSGRVTTERRAWELLSLVDQIHLWGVTSFRDSVIRHLDAWHKFGRSCYAEDVGYMNSTPAAGKIIQDGQLHYKMTIMPLPTWTESFSDDACENFETRAATHLQRAFSEVWGRIDSKFPQVQYCGVDACSPGTRLNSKEEAIAHFRDVHGQKEEELALLKRYWGQGVWAEDPDQVEKGAKLKSVHSKKWAARRRLRLRDTSKDGPDPKRRKL